jgi:hypothetical protein
MTTKTLKPNPCHRSVLFELAKEIYALHSAINQLTDIPTRREYRNTLANKMKKKLEAFSLCGGIIDTGIDLFGEKGPVLSYPQEIIPYEIGRLDCEQLLNF